MENYIQEEEEKKLYNLLLEYYKVIRANNAQIYNWHFYWRHNMQDVDEANNCYAIAEKAGFFDRSQVDSIIILAMENKYVTIVAGATYFDLTREAYTFLRNYDPGIKINIGLEELEALLASARNNAAQDNIVAEKLDQILEHIKIAQQGNELSVKSKEKINAFLTNFFIQGVGSNLAADLIKLVGSGMF